MAFFLIVPSVMIVSIVLVHALAKKLGLQIYYATLVAVAVLSIMVDFAATMITPTGGKEFLLRLGLMILGSSLLLTFANNFLIKKQREEEKIFTEEVKAAYEAEVQKNSGTATPTNKIDLKESSSLLKYNEAITETKSESAEDNVETKSESAEDNVETKSESAEDNVETKSESAEDNVETKSESAEDNVETKSESAEDNVETKSESAEDNVETKSESAEAGDELKADDEVEKLLAETKSDEEIAALLENPEPEKISALPEDFPLEEVFEPLSEVKPEEADKPIELPEEKSESKFPLEEVFEPLSEVKRETPEPKVEPEPKRTEILPLQEVFQPLSMLRLDKLEEMTREGKNSEAEDEDSFETLDDILDKAYTERAKGHAWQAIELYKTALERYRNDEYAPFVAIDLGNIYKEEAMYSKAIKIYEDALTLPAVKRNEDIKKEFSSTLEYLRVARDVLLKYHALSTPFGKLSKEVLQEIEAEFRKVQLHSAQ